MGDAARRLVLAKNLPLSMSLGTTDKSQAPVSSSSRKRAPTSSDFGVFGKSEGIFHVDPKITDRLLDLAMAEKDLDSTKVAGRPVDD